MRSTVLSILLCVSAAACTPYRHEFHKRPAFVDKATGGALPNQVTLDDGTVLYYNLSDDERDNRFAREMKSFELRREEPDGSVRLQAVLPEHVLANALECLRAEEYELLWEQVLADETRLAYASDGKGFEEFKAFFKRNRIALARTLSRMVNGMATADVRMGYMADGSLRCELYSVVNRPDSTGRRPYAFTRVDLVHEGFGLKLRMIS